MTDNDNRMLFEFEYPIDPTEVYRVEDLLKDLPIPSGAEDIRITLKEEGGVHVYTLQGDYSLLVVVNPENPAKMVGIATFKYGE
jgi:hypothetical protein